MRKKTPVRRSESLPLPIPDAPTIRFCRDCGRLTERDILTVSRCEDCEDADWAGQIAENEGYPELQDMVRARARGGPRTPNVEKYGQTLMHSSGTWEPLSGEAGGRRVSTSTPRARQATPVNGKNRVVLTATGPHADIARRAATKRGVTLSQLAADAIETLPQDIAKPKRPPSLEKGDGSAVLCIYESNAKRVRELVEAWGWKLAQFTGWLVERLEE